MILFAVANSIKASLELEIAHVLVGSALVVAQIVDVATLF